ncbi:MAG: amino acid adenylation domain-containing protein [Chlamydiales bacterium]|nr:amino acid adenylation domain-containing protein [Chlamydiales bacterium]
MCEAQTFFILGETSLTAQCIEHLLDRKHCISGLISDDPWLQAWAQERKIPLFDSFTSLTEFDYLLSIVNPKLIPKKIIQSAKRLAINYHDSPLPAYAGVHATSWAILNNEKKHGITWHIITEQIDAGGIVKQVIFPIDNGETALSLNIKCYQHALQSFKELVVELEEGSCVFKKQDLSGRSYFGSHKKPKHAGIISWDQNAREIETLFKALDFGNYPNKLCSPKLLIKEYILFPSKMEILDHSSEHPPGTIIKITGTQIEVATNTSDILLTVQENDSQKILTMPGECLASLDNSQKLEEFCYELSFYENFWVKELQKTTYLNLGQYSSSLDIPFDTTLNLPTSLSKESLLAAILIYFYRISQQSNFTVNYQNIPVGNDLNRFSDLFITDLPLNVSFVAEDTFLSAQEKICNALQILKNKKAYLKDLPLRYPELSNSSQQTSFIGIQYVDDIAQGVVSNKYSLQILISNPGNQCRIISSQNLAFLLRSTEHLLSLLEAMNTNTPIISLPLLSQVEKKQILTWSENNSSDCFSMCTHKLIERYALKNPKALAIACDESFLSYEELNNRAEIISKHLCLMGVGPEVNVVLCLEKSLALVIAMLAVMKSGGAFVPLEPSQPEERLHYILNDAKPILVLTQKSLEAKLMRVKTPLCFIEEALAPKHEKQDKPFKQLYLSNRAYIIYTSGSTGFPKGVEVEHKQLAFVLKAKALQYPLKHLKFLWVGSISFDISIANILLPLISGGTLYFSAKVSNTDSDSIVQLLNRHKINHFGPPVSLYSLILEQNKKLSCPTLEYVCVGGEALTDSIVLLHQKYFPQAVLFNEYGPTECTIVSSYSKVYDPNIFSSAPISIGKPIERAKMYVLDHHLQILPIGVRGEIYIGGEGVARGYVNNPELTHEKFINSSLFGRLYKTADLGCWLPHGEIQFVGRSDQQIKFRGYRIELEEIERTLCGYKGIQQAVVSLTDNGKRLIAYLVLEADHDSLVEDSLRSHLNTYLPVYMIPSAFFILDKFPLTINGKIDRNALPEPIVSRSGNLNYKAPRTADEQSIAEIWSWHLKVERIGLLDSFFELGGHSLLAVQVIVSLQNTFKIEIPLKSLYEHPILEKFVQFITDSKASTTVASVEAYPKVISNPSDRFLEFPLTDIQQAYWIGRNEVFSLSQIAVHGYSEYECDHLDLNLLENSWNQLIRRHEALRLIFPGDGMQKILPEVSHYTIQCFDFSKETEKATETHLDKLRERLSHQVLPTEIWPLFEVCVTKKKNSYRLHFSIDGLIVDGWSFNILLSEWAKLYFEPEMALAPLGVSFRDYVLTEIQLKQRSLYNRDKNYWLSRLSDFPIGPSLPLFKHPKEIEKPVFDRCTKKLEKHLWGPLKEQIKARGLTPTSFLLALFGEILQFWSNSSRFTITLTLFNRLPFHPQINEIMGDFTSLTLCEIDNREKTTFVERTQKLQARLFSDIDHRLFSGIEVLRELSRQTQSSWDASLIPVVFTSLLAEESQENKTNFTTNQVYSITQTPQVWLDYKAYSQSGELVVEWDYVKGLFPDNLIEDMHQAYFRLLDRLVHSKEAWDQTCFDLLPIKQEACRNDTNATHWEVKQLLLQELFHCKAKEMPNQTAVIYEGNFLSYKELQITSNQLGSYLRHKGATPNRLVAIVMDKCLEQVIACLGILNAGAAYLPISADLPEERIVELLKLGEVDFILTQNKYLKKLSTQKLENKLLITLDGLQADVWKQESCAYLKPVQVLDDLAYVIFTSGSTGIPKGVMINHRGAVNTILDMNERFKVNHHDRVLAISNLNFDLSVYDIFGLLACGGTIVIPRSEDIKEPVCWLELLQLYKVTIWNSVPMFMSMLVEYLKDREEGMSTNTALRLVLLSGDWIPLDLPHSIKEFFHQPDVISLGGATEASIWSIIYPINNVLPEWKSIPYGLPLRNQEMHVLNEYLQSCPDGVQGDIYIGGIGLAKGYWMDKKRSDAQFIFHASWKKQLYKTGDLGRYYPNGVIEFLGRSDSQVKVNGYRIELGEIQKTLESHKDISHALITTLGEKDKEKQLIAYLALSNNQAPEIQSAEIQDPVDRINFKLSLANTRRVLKEHKNIQFDIPKNDYSKLFRRKSYRCYDGNKINSSILINILCKSLKSSGIMGKAREDAIPLSKFDSFLMPLTAYRFPESPIPKYTYPSAGALYPVQVYIKVNSISGIDAGVYFFNQTERRLCLVDDELLPLDDPNDHFTLYLVGRTSLIKPMYGDLWREFCELEIGYIVHLLNKSAVSQDFQLMMKHMDGNEPITILGASYVNVKQECPLAPEVEVCVYIKPEALIDLTEGWYQFETKAKKLILIKDTISFNPQLAVTDYYSILMEASFTLFFLSDAKNYARRVQIGMFAQHIMEKGIDELIGFCPIGTLDNNCTAQYREILGSQHVLHVLTGGPVSQAQLQERGSSIPKPPEERLSQDLQLFLKDKLPDYFIPSFFLVLEKFPLSVNGKIDYKSLPIPQNGQSISKRYIPPRTDVEEKLATIWSEVLKIGNIGIQDHFFLLGGHSLSGVQVLSRIRKVFSLDFPIKKIFEYPILEALATQIAKESEKTSQFVYPPITKEPHSKYYPLSFTQQRLWFLDQLLDNKLVYMIPLAFRLKGFLVLDKLKIGLTNLIKHHEILRTVFISEMGIAKQTVLETSFFDLPVYDLLKENSLVTDHMEEEAITPFDLSKGPLIRGRLLKIEENEHIFLLTIHHIITDEWSIRVLLREISYLYNSLSELPKTQTASDTIEYVDFTCWQRNWLKDSILEKQLKFWKNELENCTDLLQLPTDKQRPQRPTHQGAIFSYIIPSKLTDLLKKTAESQKVTLFMVLLGAFQTFLHRYSGQIDIITGFPVANRHYPGVENLLGYFANTVVLRTTFHSESNFKEILSQIRDKTTKIYENQDVPFEYLVDYLKIPRDLSRHPLFQVMFVYRNSNLTELILNGLEVEELPVNHRAAKFDLVLTAEETLNELKLEFEYAVDLFDKSTIQRMSQNFIKLLESIVANLDQQVSLLDIVAEQEYDKIIHEWNKTECLFTAPFCLHQLFEKRAGQSPEHPALIFEEKIISYAELNKQSNRLARYLRKLNISSDVIVGIALERSIELVIAIYSTMKAGGAYLPLELTYPKDRLNYMLEDASVEVVITLTTDRDKFLNFKGTILCLDQLEIDESEENLSIDYPLSSLAYVIYTSGSTGQPKGVCIEHKGLVNRILWMQNEYQLLSYDRVLQKTPFSFDVSVWEFFWPLSFGASLVIAKPKAHRDTEELIYTIQRYFITCMHFVPSMLGSFLELQGGEKCSSLRMVFTSGEALPPHFVRQFFEQTSADLHNLYGPTEASIDVTYWNCRNSFLDISVPIGKPIWNTETYILDKHLNTVPIGVAGELYLSGAGLARCYLNKPSLTAEKFLQLPFKPCKRAYKTGDLARYFSDGNIEFLGRLDHQVKMRGYRIELGEIENRLGGHPEVLQCVVDVCIEKTGHKSLVAFVVLKNPIDDYLLRNYLSEKIPDYMVPSQFIVTDHLPLTTSGKVDRKALKQNQLIYHRSRTIVAPRNELESDLVQIWKHVLQVETIGVTDNFFELGGDSILSIQIVATAKKWGYSLQLADLFSFPTIEKLWPRIKCYELNEKTPDYTPFSLVNSQDKQLLDRENLEDAYPLASLQAGMIYHNELNPDEAVYQDTFSYEMEGELKENLLSSILEAMISIHPVLRTSFKFEDYSEPLQLVHCKGILQIEFVDISCMDLTTQDKHIEEWFRQEKEKRFILTSPTLIRFAVHSRSERTFQFGFTFHHAILDGWSIATLVAHMIQEYETRIEGGLSSLHQPRLRYGAYIQHEKQLTSSTEQLDFWKKKLNGFHTLKVYDNFKQGANKKGWSSDSKILKTYIVEKLHELAKRLNVPLKSVLLAAYLRVLSRISGESDITTGYILNGRLEELDSENTLGLFLNTVPLRLILDGGRWEDLVLAVYEEEKKLLPYRWYPLAQIQHQHGGRELFNTSFNYAHFHVYDKLKENKHLQLISHKAYEKTNFVFSANFYVDTLQENLCLSLEYDSDKISNKKVGEIFDYFKRALKSLAYNSNSLYQHDSLLSKNELNTLFNTWNNSEKQLVCVSSVVELFEERVQKIPEQTAAIFDGRSITYQELNEQANQIAYFLKKQEHISLIALSAERSIEMIVGLIGILKAGKGFLPLDPNYPIDRLNYIFKSSDAQILLTQNHLWSRFENYPGRILDIDFLIHSNFDKVEHSCQQNVSDVAYVLYTSGSTGIPKGVVVGHEALLNQIQWLQHTYQLTELDKVLHHSSLAFDVSVEEIFWPLCSGATVVVAAKDVHQDIEGLIDFIEEKKISILDLVPSLLEVILQHSRLERLKSLRQVLVGGEVLHHLLIKKFYKNLSANLHNMYGLTETTITSTYHPCTSSTILADLLIGRPIWNTKTYILDKHLCPLPIGVPGEICISGRGLAHGYLDQDDLTKQRFVLNPFTKDGTLLFRTGDLGYYCPDGSIAFLGRSDNQIKIRGQRVELGEIESILRQHYTIHHAVVELQEDVRGSQQLIAYIVLKDTFSFDEEELKKWLKQWIPEAWVPLTIVSLSQLPLLLSGKIDRKALPKVALISKKLILPSTPIEKILAQIWCEVLQLKEIGINENFFALGGNSLSITIAAMHIRKQFVQNIPLRVFLENPTIANLASLLDEQMGKLQQVPSFEEIFLPASITPQPKQIVSSSIANVLLTGATGFLGAHLLFDLLENSKVNVFCLVRAIDKEEAQNKLVYNFKRYFPEAVFSKDRIVALPGDLSLSRLGLDEQNYQTLAKKLDAIYHCGALVHHLYDYKTLMAPNVLSVIEVLKLAVTGTLKKVIYISTLSIAEEEQGTAQEKFITGTLPSILNSGYEQTKWMAEKLLTEAFSRGIPIQIFRPSTIIGHSLTGVSSYENDHLMRLIKGCIQLEKAPDWEFKLDMLPVDGISKIITKISLDEKNKNQIFNLSNPEQISWLDLIRWLKDFGYEIEIISHNIWQALLTKIDADNALFSLLALYIEDEVTFEEVVNKNIEIRNTLEALANLRIDMPSVNNQILHKAFCYLSEMFFTKQKDFLNEK